MDVNDLARRTIAEQSARIDRLRRVVERSMPILDMMAVTDDHPEYESVRAAAKAALAEKD